MKQRHRGSAGPSPRTPRRSFSAFEQLELDLSVPRGGDGVTVTRPLARHRSLNRILAMVCYVRRFFPELAGRSLRVGLTRAASGMAIPGGNELWVNPYRLSYHTLAHEFIHLLQTAETGIPRGEKACDVFSLARHWSLNDTVPSYVRVSRRLAEADGRLSGPNARVLFVHAARAIENRRRGIRCYIARFERELAQAIRAAQKPQVRSRRASSSRRL